LKLIIKLYYIWLIHKIQQGEGAPLSRKGMCANHISTVRSFFKGIHVTMNARTDEEVDPDLIIQTVSKAISSDGVKMSSNIETDTPVGPVVSQS